jgi:hypothetical protein
MAEADTMNIHLLSKNFLDFHGGMIPHTSLEIELCIGRIEYALPKEVPNEITGYNELDHFDKPMKNTSRFFLTRAGGAKHCIGRGNYRIHYYGSDDPYNK